MVKEITHIELHAGLVGINLHIKLLAPYLSGKSQVLSEQGSAGLAVQNEVMVVANEISRASLAHCVRCPQVEYRPLYERSFSVGDKLLVDSSISVCVNSYLMLLDSPAEAVKVEVGMVCESDRSLALGVCLVVDKNCAALKLVCNEYGKLGREALLTVGRGVGKGYAVLGSFCDSEHLVVEAVAAVKAVSVIVLGKRIKLAVHLEAGICYSVCHSSDSRTLMRGVLKILVESLVSADNILAVNLEFYNSRASFHNGKACYLIFHSVDVNSFSCGESAEKLLFHIIYS